MTALKNMTYLRENEFLKEEFFFQLQKGSTSKLQLNLIAFFKICFHRRGSSRFLESPYDNQDATFILTSYIVSACLSFVLRLTVVVYLHYQSYVKWRLIDKHALII